MKKVIVLVFIVMAFSCKKDDVETLAPAVAIDVGTLKQKVVTDYYVDYDTNEVKQEEVLTHNYDNGKVSTIVSDINSNHNQQFYYDKNGVLIRYNNMGKGVQGHILSYFPDQFFEYRFSYLNGHISQIDEYRYNGPDQVVSYSQSFKFEDNKIITVPRYGGDNVMELSINEKGLYSEFKIFKEEKLTSEEKLTFDNFGNISKSQYLQYSVDNSEIIENRSYEYSYLEAKNPEKYSMINLKESYFILVTLLFNKYPFPSIGLAHSFNLNIIDSVEVHSTSQQIGSSEYDYEYVLNENKFPKQVKEYIITDNVRSLSRVTDYTYN